MRRTTYMLQYHTVWHKHRRRLRSARQRCYTERLVCVLVLSRLDYCNVVLAGLPASTLAPLQRVTSRARSEATWQHQFQSTSTALVANRWTSDIIMALPYRPQRSSRTSAGLHYWLTSASHHPTTSSRSSLRAASRGDYVVPRTNRRFADRTFSTAAPQTWNQLPTYLKMTQLTFTFRRGLKTFLFHRAYSSE